MGKHNTLKLQKELLTYICSHLTDLQALIQTSPHLLLMENNQVITLFNTETVFNIV